MDDAAATASLDPGLAGQDARPVEGVDNGYVAGYRVRFDEAGPDGLLRTSALLRYAQDVAWRHSERLGFDRAWYRERGLGWVVRSVELDVVAPIPLGTTLRVATAVVGHRRIWARRICECRFADGRPAARITTGWVLIDGRNRIVRIPDDFGVSFPNPELDDEMLRIPPETGSPAASHRLAVRPGDLDPLDHVNNAVYVDWLDEAVEAAGWAGPAAPARSLQVEYAAAAARGDRIAVDLFGGASAWRARIRREDGPELVRAVLSAATG